ncbi:IS66 family insertion sequence element accessory protein TnpB [Bradyrhizobium tunisiense]|uniref:IS66 family insertion sequence element accessory protein TnpB n=1 Tax=Bradyrhizobium tunisiense TaxID=3278709 RepID=UPI0035E09275
MLTPPASLMIYVATQPVDFRTGAEGLALLAKETLGHDPMKGVAVVFRAKRADRVKIVVWDGSGLVLYWKRLEGSAFKWPPVVDGIMRMNAAQLSALLSGMDWTPCTRLESHSRKRLRKDTNLRCISARSMAELGQ